jgi:hypothetical protein
VGVVYVYAALISATFEETDEAKDVEMSARARADRRNDPTDHFGVDNRFDSAAGAPFDPIRLFDIRQAHAQIDSALAEQLPAARHELPVERADALALVDEQGFGAFLS